MSETSSAPTSYSRASPCRLRITTQVRALPHRHLRKRPELRLPRRAAHPWLATARIAWPLPLRESLRSAAVTIFAIALLHTFSTRTFSTLAHAQPAMRGCGICLAKSRSSSASGPWSVLLIFLVTHSGAGHALHYLESRNFTEPAFVFVIMVIAASRPIIDLAGALSCTCSREHCRWSGPLPTTSRCFRSVRCSAPSSPSRQP